MSLEIKASSSSPFLNRTPNIAGRKSWRPITQEEKFAGNAVWRKYKDGKIKKVPVKVERHLGHKDDFDKRDHVGATIRSSGEGVTIAAEEVFYKPFKKGARRKS